MSLSPEQIQFYRDEGYILLENIIAPNNLVRVREKISEFLERSREVSASNATSKCIDFEISFMMCLVYCCDGVACPARWDTCR